MCHLHIIVRKPWHVIYPMNTYKDPTTVILTLSKTRTCQVWGIQLTYCWYYLQWQTFIYLKVHCRESLIVDTRINPHTFVMNILERISIVWPFLRYWRWCCRFTGADDVVPGIYYTQEGDVRVVSLGQTRWCLVSNKSLHIYPTIEDKVPTNTRLLSIYSVLNDTQFKCSIHACTQCN